MKHAAAKYHRFDASSAIEQRWAPVLDDWARDSGYQVRAATETEQLKGIDRVMVHPEDGLITVDYKCCQRAIETGNLFIETTSNDQTNRPGWAWTSQANFLLYFAVPETVWVFCMAYLRRVALPSWIKRWPARAAANATYNTLGIPVPAPAASLEAEYVGRLSLGDGLILQIGEQHARTLQNMEVRRCQNF